MHDPARRASSIMGMSAKGDDKDKIDEIQEDLQNIETIDTMKESALKLFILIKK